MKVVILQRRPELGTVGQIVEVNESYARNFLIPNKIAVPATPAAIKQQQRHASAKQHDDRQRQQHEADIVERLKTLWLTLHLAASASGTLFAAVQERDLRAGLARDHQLTLPSSSRLSGLPIKQVGEHLVTVKTPHGHQADLRVMIQPR